MAVRSTAAVVRQTLFTDFYLLLVRLGRVKIADSVDVCTIRIVQAAAS
jgi:hypothetical protein